MKKKLLATLITLIAFISITACKSDAKKETNTVVSKKEVSKSTAAFVVMNAKNDINFTAYKTTEKIPVGGQFKKVEVLSGGQGNSVKEAINNTEFSIPVASLFTKDTSRDYKIRKYFFGVMSNTNLLSGKLILTDDTNGVAKMTMNGETKDVPFTYTIKDNTFAMQATINVNDWNAAKALASLNKICEDLHKGADGVSKTWSEVALNITSTFN